MHITVSLDDVMKQFASRIDRAGKRAPEIMAAGLNAGGDSLRQATIAAETGQTGLSKAVISRAQRAHRAHGSRLVYEIEASGGDVRIKHFRPRETRAGVAASPWNKRQVFAGTFMKAGWPQGKRWAKRKAKPNWNGQAFRRTGGKTRTGMDEFEHAKSGLYIPTELVTGATAAAFDSGAAGVLDATLTGLAKAFDAS